jgi:uncharacterized protein YcgL (UPF0745 family)
MSDPVTCYVYRGNRKSELYLFLAEEDNFECVPEAIMKGFGRPTKAMELELTSETKMARSNPADIIAGLKEHGFHLQMPPAQHELVEEVLSREADKS